MQAWADLFACAPESFVLTGDFEPDIQQYKPLHCERDTVVNTLRAISLLASRVDASHYVLHLGI
jgi:hypothetical protein